MFFSPSCTLKSQFQLPYHKTSNFSVNKPSPNWRMPSISKCRIWQKDHNALFEWGQRTSDPEVHGAFSIQRGFWHASTKGMKVIHIVVGWRRIFSLSSVRRVFGTVLARWPSSADRRGKPTSTIYCPLFFFLSETHIASYLETTNTTSSISSFCAFCLVSIRLLCWVDISTSWTVLSGIVPLFNTAHVPMPIYIQRGFWNASTKGVKVLHVMYMRR